MFRLQIRHLAESGFRHVYVFGTAGEGYAVDSARFRQVIEAFGDETAKHGITPMVGVIGLSTANVLERLAHRVRPRIPRVPVLAARVGGARGRRGHPLRRGGLRRLPRRGVPALQHGDHVGRLVTGPLYRELVARVPNLVATKTMTGDLGVVAGVVREAPELMHFLTEQSVAYWLAVR